MQVKEFMTESPACCAPDATLRAAASLMAENDCGEIPVLDAQRRPVGVLTDRDIACRAVAQGKGPDTPVQDVMSSPIVTVTPDMSLEDCCDIMEQNKVRRVPVVDESGACRGMVSQADIAQNAPDYEAAQLVRELSQPSAQPAHAG